MLAEALEDERLADLLEELSEDEQVRLIESLDPERVGRVLDEMEADDAADLLGELSADEQAELLAAMDPEEAEPVRRLLGYKPDTAGGLMTPEPIILGPNETVARGAGAGARSRPAGAARRPGVRLPAAAGDADRAVPRRRRDPAAVARGAVEADRPLHRRGLGSGQRRRLRDREVAARLAAYNVVAIPVTDESGRLVGAVTIDDVLDRVLPAGWRLTAHR